MGRFGDAEDSLVDRPPPGRSGRRQNTWEPTQLSVTGNESRRKPPLSDFDDSKFYTPGIVSGVRGTHGLAGGFALIESVRRAAVIRDWMHWPGRRRVMVPAGDSIRTTTTMGSEHGQNSVKGELPLTTQTVQPKKACGFAHRRRAIGVGVLIGVALWFAHKRHTSAPEPWLEGHLDLLGHGEPGPLTGKEAEESFL
jgi:hypothetical protein